MPTQQLKDYLDQHKTKYVCMNHSPAFTAQEAAQAAHIGGKHFAKSVIVKVDGNLAMVVCPAKDRINLKDLGQELGASNIELAHEYEFKDKFPDCDIGAMPPFGNLYNMDVYVTDDLSHCDEIAFNAGNHSELIQLSYDDYEDLVHPNVIKI